MKARMKRLVVKASLLSVVVNGVLLFAKFREQRTLSSHDYLMAAASFVTTLVLISGIAFLFFRFGHHPENEKKS